MCPTDYEAVKEVLTFDHCESRRCVTIRITNDLVYEPEETFSLSLTRTSNTSPFVSFSSATAEVVITDDGK